MKLHLYRRLAAEGIRKNRRLYLPYMMAGSVMVMIHYLLHFLESSPIFKEVRGGDFAQLFMGFGGIVIRFFALLFLFYTNSFLIRQRSREFGLYNVLGMDKRNLTRIMIWESVISTAISIGGGLLFGILFSKLAELGFFYILELDAGYAMSVSVRSLALTLRFFLEIYLFLLICTIWRVWRLNPLELLQSTQVGEKPPKAQRLTALFGLLLLGSAYYLAVTIKEPLQAILVFVGAVLMVIAATYILFITGSVTFCRLLQKNKRYYYKPNHFVSVSSMAYRMKRNGAGLASICILSTMILVMLSCTVALYVGDETTIQSRFPRHINMDVELNGSEGLKREFTDQLEDAMTTNAGAAYPAGTEAEAEMGAGAEASAEEMFAEEVSAEEVSALEASAEEVSVAEASAAESSANAEEGPGTVPPLRQNIRTYRRVEMYGLPLDGGYSINMDRWVLGAADPLGRVIQFFSLEDFNELMGTDAELADDECLIYCYGEKYGRDTFAIAEGGNWRVKAELDNFFESGFRSELSALSLMDVVVKDLDAAAGTFCDRSGRNGQPWAYPEWICEYDIEGGNDEKTARAEASRAGEEIEQIRLATGAKIRGADINMRVVERRYSLMMDGGLLFLGLLLSIVFVIASVLIIYYKQISEGFEDQARFGIMQSVGMTKREIRKSINSQILTVFFLPLVFAGIHLMFAFPLLWQLLRLFGSVDLPLFVRMAQLCFLVYGVCYAAVYKLTAGVYYGIVSGTKE